MCVWPHRPGQRLTHTARLSRGHWPGFSSLVTSIPQMFYYGEPSPLFHSRSNIGKTTTMHNHLRFAVDWERKERCVRCVKIRWAGWNFILSHLEQGLRMTYLGLVGLMINCRESVQAFFIDIWDHMNCSFIFSGWKCVYLVWIQMALLYVYVLPLMLILERWSSIIYFHNIQNCTFSLLLS